MKTTGRLSVIAFTLFLALTALPSHATTLAEVVDGISAVRNPVSLTSLSFLGDVRLDIDTQSGGLLPEQVSLLAAWQDPSDWFCTYELSGALATGLRAQGGGHPALDHVLLSRPDFLDILDIAWEPQYQGSAIWDGSPAWMLLFTTRDITLDTPGFTLYVRKDDFVPLRTEVEFDDGTMAITDLTWFVIDDVVVPAKYTTTLMPSIGGLNGYETTYFNHEINPDLSGVDFPRDEGTLLTIPDTDTGDDAGSFSQLYHGFADNPIIAPIDDSSGTYDRLEFTFSLYVEDESLPHELDIRIEPIRTLAEEIVSGWEWSGDDGLSMPGGKYDCGREILTAINELLGSEAITDFYFLDFEPLEPEEE